MIRREKNGIIWLEFELFAENPHLKHGVFLRHGGQSRGEFSSLNLSYSAGDQTQDVATNLKRVASILDLPTLISPFQCHGKAIAQVRGGENPTLLQCDALTTSCPDIGLLIKHADCQSAIIYDPIHHAMANVHSGWRGSVQNIYQETIRFMKRAYGSLPQELLVGISPSLGPGNAEFIHYRSEFPKDFWQFQVKPCYFDFWEISRWQLMQCGILPHHIEIAEMCTYSMSQDCFSYRREKRSGRLGTIVALT
ncbi:MAG: peptidoglycan editing factor PgeF [Waddliaceae bacterium]